MRNTIAYNENINQMIAWRKFKAPYTEKINTHISYGCCVHRTIAYGYLLDPLKIYCKVCVEKFVNNIGDKEKQLNATFPQQPLAELTRVVKKDHESAKNVISVKSLTPRIE